MNDSLKQELDALADAARKEGRPMVREDVLTWAEANPESALHAELFAEEEGEAARRYRLHKAGQLIRAYIKVLPAVHRPVRAHVHVPSDANGYRRVEDVSGNPLFRSELVNDALAKLSRMRLSYAYLPEMDSFWARLDSLIAAFRLEMTEQRKTG